MNPMARRAAGVCDTRDEMNPVARQYPGVTYNSSKNCGNIENSNNTFESCNIDNSYNNIFENCNISISDEKHQVLEWLSQLTSRNRHQEVGDARADGVGDWLLCTEEFSTWSELEVKAAKPVLLCYGDPGVGKTYITSLVIDTLGSEVGGVGVAVAYVYCDFSARSMQSTSTVLGSVLRQVVGTLAWIPDEVQKAFEKAKSQADGCGLRLPQIREMLIKSLSSLKRGIICIDALDEFSLKHRPELWESLQEIVRESSNTRLFLTGRPHIRDEVRRYFAATAEMLPISPRGRDIELYLRMRLSRDPEYDAMDEGLRADILRVIPETISGIFLLVRINMDAILVEPTIHRRRQALHRITSALSLQDAYNTTMDRIRKQGGSKSKLGMEALMWTSRCERPLTSEELCHALGVELGTEDISVDNVPTIRTVLACTLGLVTINKVPATVHLLHFTLQEYLGQHPTLFVTAHSMMAEICLTYLNSQLARALPPNPDGVLATAPFIEYATCFWGTHAAREVTELVKSLSSRLLDTFESHISAAILWRKVICPWPEEEVVRGIGGLHCISFLGITEIAIAMLEVRRWDVNRRDSIGGTPLWWAAIYGNYGVAELLLAQEGIEPDLAIWGGRTVLSLVVGSGGEDIVKLLLGHRDVNPDSSDSNGRTPLSYAAARRGAEGIVKLFLDRDVNPNSSDNTGRTPLLFAALERNEGVVKLLLERGDVNPNSSDISGRTPLSYAAARRGAEGIVKLFLDRGDVNPNSPDNNGRTPLLFAALERNEGVVKLLLERGDVNPNSSDINGRTPLSYSAAEWRAEGIVELLLERRDANTNSSDSNGRTPLSYAAAQRGTKNIAKLLLQRGDVNPDSSDNNGRTPLSYAVSSWRREGIVKLLLECRDVNPNSSDSNGRTPLSYAAAERGTEDIVKLLLERGDVNPDSPDSNCRTPLSFAALGGHIGVVKLLLERRDVNPDSLDNYFQTPLLVATVGGHDRVVRTLLARRDVNPNSPDRDGQTPLLYAAQ